MKKNSQNFWFESCPPNFFDNFLIKDYKKKRLHYFVYIVCVLIHINFEQCIICGCVLFKIFCKIVK